VPELAPEEVRLAERPREHVGAFEECESFVGQRVEVDRDARGIERHNLVQLRPRACSPTEEGLGDRLASALVEEATLVAERRVETAGIVAGQLVGRLLLQADEEQQLLPGGSRLSRSARVNRSLRSCWSSAA
jgi:hypothetical protein